MNDYSIPFQPTVDVVIPVYNGESFIEEAVKSALAQTYSLTQLIVVNDGSTDRTEELLHGLARQDARVLVVSKKNGGLSSARNAGISAGKSAFVAFLDADDIWYPEKIEAQIAVFRGSADSGLGLVFCDYELIDSKGALIENFGGPTLNPLVKGAVAKKLIGGNYISSSGSGVLIKRECFVAVGDFDEKLASAEDWDMWLRIAQKYTVDFTPKILVKIRRHGSNMQRDSARMTLNELRVLGKFVSDPELQATALKTLHGVLDGYCAPRLIVSVLKQAKQEPALENIVREIRQRPAFILMIVARTFNNSNFFARLKAVVPLLKNILKPKEWFIHNPASPLVTVLMRAHNVAGTVEQAMRSILAQTFINYELIVIDDGSSDDTGKIVKRFGDSRIRLIKNDHPLGAIACLNQGMGQARGRFTALIDGNDIARKERIERQVAALESNSSVGLVTCWGETLSQSGEVLDTGNWRMSSESYFFSLNFRNMICPSSQMFRTNSVKHLVGRFSSLGELWAQMSHEALIRQIPRVLVSFRKREEDTSKAYEDFRFARLNKLSVGSISTEAIDGFSDVRAMFHLSEEGRKAFVRTLPEIYWAVFKETPPFYDSLKLRDYISEDLEFYALSLQTLGETLDLSGELRPSWFAQLKGALQYLAQCHHVLWLYRFIEKEHI